jgi:hypothetical protein
VLCWRGGRDGAGPRGQRWIRSCSARFAGEAERRDDPHQGTKRLDPVDDDTARFGSMEMAAHGLVQLHGVRVHALPDSVRESPPWPPGDETSLSPPPSRGRTAYGRDSGGDDGSGERT